MADGSNEVPIWAIIVSFIVGAVVTFATIGIVMFIFSKLGMKLVLTKTERAVGPTDPETPCERSQVGLVEHLADPPHSGEEESPTGEQRGNDPIAPPQNTARTRDQIGVVMVSDLSGFCSVCQHRVHLRPGPMHASLSDAPHRSGASNSSTSTEGSIQFQNVNDFLIHVSTSTDGSNQSQRSSSVTLRRMPTSSSSQQPSRSLDRAQIHTPNEHEPASPSFDQNRLVLNLGRTSIMPPEN